MVSDYRTTATQRRSQTQYRLIVSGHPTVTYTSSTATYNNSTGDTTYAGQEWMDFWYETVLTSYQPSVWQEECYPTADEDYHYMLWWKFENRRRMKATPYFKAKGHRPVHITRRSLVSTSGWLGRRELKRRKGK